MQTIIYRVRNYKCIYQISFLVLLRNVTLYVFLGIIYFVYHLIIIIQCKHNSGEMKKFRFQIMATFKMYYVFENRPRRGAIMLFKNIEIKFYTFSQNERFHCLDPITRSESVIYASRMPITDSCVVSTRIIARHTIHAYCVCIKIGF